MYGLYVSKITFLEYSKNYTQKQLFKLYCGTGETGTRVLFLVHCTPINLCYSNFPLLVVHKNAPRTPHPHPPPPPPNNEELGLQCLE